jgi:TATA-box binding protein (TBP) (component of TFIID and TFIIIB)
MLGRYTDAFIKKLKDGTVRALREELSHEWLRHENEVVKGDLGDITIDINQFAKTRPYAYVPNRFKAVVVRYHENQLMRPTTILLFTTGKFDAVGSKSPEQTACAIHKLRFDLARDGIKATKCDFRIVNMVYVVRLPNVKNIDIAKIHYDDMDDSHWNPVVFPGLCITKGGVSIRVFDTNPLVLMSITDPSQVKAIVAQVAKSCKRYQLERLPPTKKRYEDRIKRHDEIMQNMPTV